MTHGWDPAEKDLRGPLLYGLLEYGEILRGLLRNTQGPPGSTACHPIQNVIMHAHPAEGQDECVQTPGLPTHALLPHIPKVAAGQEAALLPPQSYLKWCIVVHQGAGRGTFWKEPWTKSDSLMCMSRLPGRVSVVLF